MPRTFIGLLCAVCLFAASRPGAAAGGQDVRQQIQITAPGPGEMPMFMGPNRQPKTGTGVLRGRVIASDTGSPIRRAQVRVTSPDIGVKTALTDAQGRFEFKDLPASRFNVSVTKSGFVTMQYGQNRPFEPGRPIELAEAQRMEKVDIALPRGSVLAGRVVDEFGEPVADANVSAMRMQFANGKRRLVPSGRNSQTNDLGQFRIYGLPPGDYYVSATLRSFDNMMMDLGGPGGPTGSNQNSGYAPTYYPGSTSPAEAQRVTLAVGQELASVDIALQPVRLAKITGTAIGTDGKPLSGAMVMLMPSLREAVMFGPGGTSRTNSDGQFTINGVTPGDYTLQLRSMGPMVTEVAGGGTMMFAMNAAGPGAPPAGPQTEPEFAAVPVSVSGEDINNLVVVATHGAKATGRVTFEGGAKPEDTPAIRITSPSADQDGGPVIAFGGSPVKANGSFELNGLTGTRLFRAVGLPKGWFLKSVRYDDRDVTDTGIEFKPGDDDVAGIEIELTKKTTTLSGSVTDDRGQAAKDYTVVVFSDDQQKWMLPLNRWTTSARPDQDGRFKLTSLPPGGYYAVAVEYVAAGEWSDPDWLERARTKATHFTLDEGGTRSLELKLAGI